MTISQGGVGVLQKATNHYDDYKTAFILGLNIGPSKQFVFSTYRILIDFGFGAQLDAFKFKDEGGGNADLGIGIFANAAFQCDIVKPLYFEVGIHGELDMALGVYAIPNYEIESTDFIWQISPYACIGFRF
jgi:hypothetical protein